MIGLARKRQQFPDYFTAEQADAVVSVVPTYPIRMAFRIMLTTGTLTGTRRDQYSDGGPGFRVSAVEPGVPGLLPYRDG